MALERGLGKGLGALLGDAALQSQEGGSLSLPISQVEPGPKPPRKRFDEESLPDLAASIRIHGTTQPPPARRPRRACVGLRDRHVRFHRGAEGGGGVPRRRVEHHRRWRAPMVHGAGRCGAGRVGP